MHFKNVTKYRSLSKQDFCHVVLICYIGYGKSMCWINCVWCPHAGLGHNKFRE